MTRKSNPAGADPYSAALISLSVPSTPTRKTLTRTPRPFGTSSTEGLFRSARWTLLRFPGNTLIAFISFLRVKNDLEHCLRTPRQFARASCVYLTRRSAGASWSRDQSSPSDGLHLHLCQCPHGSTREKESARSNWDQTGISECPDRQAARLSHRAGKSAKVCAKVRR